MPRQFDLIAFDWDGTLFDSTALIVRCIQDACRDVGTAVPSNERAAYVIGLGLRDALLHAAPDFPPARYPELGDRYRHHYLARQHELVLFEGTLAMLNALMVSVVVNAASWADGGLSLDEFDDVVQHNDGSLVACRKGRPSGARRVASLREQAIRGRATARTHRSRSCRARSACTSAAR
jgi:beta-phosphoglucomutase-like phosphatase (HAD superfamily)